MSTGPTEERKGVILKFRTDGDTAFAAQLIADAETGGNVSELLRALLSEKIQQKRGAARAAEPKRAA